MKVRNTFIIFLVSGFWHGANWTFVVWGALNAFYFLPLLLFNKNRTNLGVVADGKFLPSSREVINMGFTFFLTVIAWIFFRAENLGHATYILEKIFSLNFLHIPYFKNGTLALPLIGFLMIFLFIEWQGRTRKYAIEMFGFAWPKVLRVLFYYAIIISIVWGAKSPGGDFIYFQF